VDPKAAWRRVEAGLTAPGRGRSALPRAQLALALAAACLIVVLGWNGARRPRAPEATRSRISPALWQDEVVADDPLDGATEILIAAVQEATW
jgi:hypothetical protein